MTRHFGDLGCAFNNKFIVSDYASGSLSYFSQQELFHLWGYFKSKPRSD